MTKNLRQVSILSTITFLQRYRSPCHPERSRSVCDDVVEGSRECELYPCSVREFSRDRWFCYGEPPRGTTNHQLPIMKPLLFSLLLIASMHAQWQKADVETTASFRGLEVINAKVIWASGTEGTVIRTVDAGKTWSVITVPGAEKLDFRGIKAFDANTAVIISSGPAEKGQAKIFRTTDGGKS